MNNDFVAIKWILQNADKLALSVDAYKWDLPFDSQIYDCKVKIKVHGLIRDGRGSAHTEEHALLKAFSEAVDRVAFYDSKKYLTTNGLAVHSSLNNAIRAAKCELIERDAFFCHYLTKTPFASSSLKIEHLGFESDIFNFLRHNSIEFKLAEMHSVPGTYSFIFMAHGLNSPKKLGLMFGMGCNLTPEAAATSAVFEGLRHIITSINNEDFPRLPQSDFLSLKHWSPDEHMALANEQSYAQSIIPLFFNTSDAPTDNQPGRRNYDEISYEQIQLTGELQDSPFFAVKASCHKLQDIYFGPTKQESVNLLRLSEFTGKSWTWNMVNKTPHPLA